MSVEGLRMAMAEGPEHQGGEAGRREVGRGLGMAVVRAKRPSQLDIRIWMTYTFIR